MEEREFFDERADKKAANLNCPHCHQSAEYEINWLVRTKKRNLPPSRFGTSSWMPVDVCAIRAEIIYNNRFARHCRNWQGSSAVDFRDRTY